MFIKDYVRTFLVWLGLIIGWATPYVWDGYTFYLLGILSTVFLLTGCYIWTRLKNRHWVFMFWGILAPVGLLGISLLRDKSTEAY